MRKKVLTILGMVILLSIILTTVSYADGKTGEQLYKKLSAIAKNQKDTTLFEKINTKSRGLEWQNAKETEFVGNLRLLKTVDTTGDKQGSMDKTNLYLLRKTSGDLYILSIPDNAKIEEGANSIYAGLEKMLESKMRYTIKVQEQEIEGEAYIFGQFATAPERLFFDKIFKISMIIMLFSVMVGMGMTLAPKDFAMIAKKPRAIIAGTICQFGVMPLVAAGIGHMMGYAEAAPFVFVGMILVTATPGGATSNLMTYFSKGDLALSISMTASATILSIFLTPLILFLYCFNISDVQMPVKMLVLTIFILVLLPLFIGMSVRHKWEKFAEKATPFFSALGIIAVLFIMIGGVLSNLEVFSQVGKTFGVAGFLVIFFLTTIGMLLGGLIPKLIKVSNHQARAISIEIGIRNVALGMTIALLIQDSMGDFNSDMFAVSGLFGLFMYVAGVVAIILYKYLLPVEVEAKVS